MIGLYNRNGVAKIRKRVSEELDKIRGRSQLSMGDWNDRTGVLGGPQRDPENAKPTR